MNIYNWNKSIIFKLRLFSIIFHITHRKSYWAIRIKIRMSDQGLLKASERGDLNRVQQLLTNKNVNVNCKDIWILKHSWDFNLAFFLLDFKKIIYLRNLLLIFNNTPLFYAASNGHEEIVSQLLEQKGININCKNIWIQKYSPCSNLTFVIIFQKTNSLWN